MTKHTHWGKGVGIDLIALVSTTDESRKPSDNVWNVFFIPNPVDIDCEGREPRALGRWL